MNIDSFISNEGKVEIRNPQYNPKSKKNTVSPTLIVDNTMPRPDFLGNLTRYAIQNTEATDLETVKKYEDRGINYTPGRFTSGMLDKQLAESQSFGEKLWNSLAQTVVSEAAIGTVKGFADLYDLLIGSAIHEDGDYQNPVSSFLEKAQEDFRNNNPIYRDPDKDTIANGALTDAGWWFSNLPSVMSTLTLLIPGAGIGKAASSVGKATGAGMRATAAFTRKSFNTLNHASKADDAVKLGRVEQFLNNPTVKNAANKHIEYGMSALTMRSLENYQEARQVYNDMYKDAYDSLNEMSSEEYNDFIDRNSKDLEGVDVNDKDAVAKRVAKKSADRTFAFDYQNLIFDVAQMYMLGNALKMPKSMRATRKVNKAQREAKLVAQYGEKGAAEQLANRTVWNKSKDYLQDLAKARWLLTAELSEGVEEAVNFIAQQEGIYYGNLMLNPDTLKGNAERFQSYLGASELYESAMWGVLGGVVFQGGGSGLRRIYNATTNTISKNRKANEQTLEGNKTTWKEEFQTSENKRRTAEINSRYNKIETLRRRYNDIFEREISPFEDEIDNNGKRIKLTSDIEKEAAWQRAVDDYITRQTFDAIDAGNYDLFKEYLRDPNVGNILKDIAKNSDNSGRELNIEALINRMDEVAKMYDDNLVTVNSLASNVKGTPFEYVGIIARENTIAQIKAQRLQKQIDSYEESAKINEFRFANAIQEESDGENIDYKSAVSLIVASNYLKELRAAKQQIESDSSRKGSIEGQIQLNTINSKINSITRYIRELQPTVNAENTNNKLFSFINTLFATQYSMDENSDEYFDLLGSIASRNINKINSFTGENFELTDDEIVKVFGENETATGSYYVFSDQLKSHFGVTDQTENAVSKFVETAPNLAEDYNTLAALNIAKLMEQGKIANTINSVKHKIGSLNNTMNEARKAAIVKSRDILVQNAKKYGREAMLNYVFQDTPIDNMTSEDKASVDDAIAVLNLTNPQNEELAQNIQINILLGDYEARVEQAKEDSNPSSTSAPSEETPSDTSSEKTEDDVDSKSKIAIKYDVDKGLDISFVPETESNAIPYVELKDNENNTIGYELQAIENPNLKLDSNVAFNTQLFDGYDNSETRNYEVVENPVVGYNESNNLVVIKKGKIGYVDSTIEESESTTKSKESLSPTGEEEGTPVLATETLTEEEERLKEEEDAKQIAIASIRPVLFKELLTNVKALNIEKLDKEARTAAFEKELGKIREKYKDTQYLEEALAPSINVLRNKFDLIDVAIALSNVPELRSSTVVEDTATEYTQGFIDRVYKLVVEYAKAANIKQNSNGKYYINFEDFIRNINNLYNGLYEGEQICNKIRAFFKHKANDFVVITDNMDAENLLENARKTKKQRIIERIGARANYRLSIDKLFEREGEEFIKTFNSLKIGDKLQVKVKDKFKYLVYHKGKVVGELPIPKMTSDGDGFRMVNNSWITIVYPKNDSRNQSTAIKTTLHAMINDDSTVDNINDIINRLNYDALDNAKRTELIDKAYDLIKNKFKAQIVEQKEDESGNISDFTKEDVVSFVCKLWKYKNVSDFSSSQEERSVYLEEYIDRFLDKLYDNYEAISTFKEKGLDNIEVVVDHINDGELIRIVSFTEEDIKDKKFNSRNNYDKFEQSNKAFKKGDKIQVGAVTSSNILTIEGNNTMTHSKLGDTGTIHVLVPNRSGVPNYCIATAVRLNDTNLDPKSDAVKIIKAAKNYLNRTINEYLTTPNSDNYTKLCVCLTDLFGYGSNSSSISFNKSGIFKVGKNKIFIGNDRISITSESANIYLAINDPKSEKRGAFYLNNEDISNKNKARDYSIRESDLLIDSINKIFDASTFNVDFSFLQTHYSRTSTIGYDRDGKFRIVIDNTKFTYKDVSEAFIKGGLLRVNTKLEEGTNYRRKGISQAANQILEVKFGVKTKTPVEKNGNTSETTTVKPEPTQESTSAKDILEIENEDVAVDKLLKLALPDLSEQHKKELKNLGILPKNITFAETLTDNDGNKAVAQITPSTGNMVVSQWWVDVFDGNGVYNRDKEGYRKIAIRTLIHERIHKRLAEEGITKQLNKDDSNYDKTLVEQLQSVYDDFERYVNQLSAKEKKIYEPYLFKNKANIAERLEEFLVESLTSESLVTFLNEHNAYQSFEVDTEKAKTKTLWDKILTLIAKIFNYDLFTTRKNGVRVLDINKQSLLNKELLALRGALKTTGETIDNIQTENKPKQTPKFKPIGTDGSSMFSTVVEPIRENNTEYTPEMQFIKDKAIADGTFMKAPNGKPTNLNERQWLQVRTKAFKDWFGDWENDAANASKVVDENGEPLVVYHATKAIFNVFNTKHRRKFWGFENDESLQDRYGKNGMFFDKSESKARWWVDYETEIGEDPTIISMPVFLNIKNPDYTTGYNEFSERLNYVSNPDGVFVTELTHDFYEGETHFEKYIPLKNKTFKYARLTGEFVVFNPNQIKSATNNVGTFSRENDDIRYSTIVESTKQYMSVSSLLSSIPIAQQPEFSRLLDNGTFKLVCR